MTDKMTADPKSLAAQVNNICAFSGFLVHKGMSVEAMQTVFTDMVTAAASDYKALVIEELLESQRATNEALAAALSMKGVRE